MPKTLATMITITTYGTWMRGDQRGWVDDGKVMPPSPPLEKNDRMTMKHPLYTFPANTFDQVGHCIGESLRDRMHLSILAMTVQSWHVHLVISPTAKPIAEVVKCAKDAVRYGLRIGRPIWTAGYDKRFCFDQPAVQKRIEYVERHNLQSGLPAKPWPFIIDPVYP